MADEDRALLITDIVDSTRLVERLGDADAAALWTAHDRLARDLLRGLHGREIDKTDGLLLLFDEAADAVRYAAAYHRALQTLDIPLKARAGLHVGNAVLRENSAADVALGAKPVEVDGIGKLLASRVMSIAHGGQTLMTAAAREALRDAAVPTHSHGHWRLKGFSEPVEVFEAVDADGAFIPPADAPKAYRVVRDGDLWMPARRIPHSLPAERDAFVGRGEALDDLARHFEGGTRLVTVTGLGGAGKTRLATRFGWTWLGEFPGGVWFCDLSQAQGLDGIFYAVSQGLDVPLGKEDPAVQLGNAISAREHCLVILDNFEQVVQEAEATLGRWLDKARHASFLVTSRNVLGIHGETVLPLAPLRAAEATELFMRRAQAAKGGFQARKDDAAAIERLVHLLEGLPLAIELAAARVRVMSPRMLLSRMSERFKLLSSISGRHDRQSALRAAFDWSWDLLTLPEKAALAQLSVFEGGFTLEAAEAVLDLSAYEPSPWPADLIQSLLEKSFVRRVDDERFDMLGSVREYAYEHLRFESGYAGSGPAACDAAEQRHGMFFAALDERAATAGRCVELGNFVAACRRAAGRGDAAAAGRLLETAWCALQLCGPFGIGVEVAALVCGMPQVDPGVAARACWIEGCALQALGRIAEARERFNTALAAALEAGDRSSEAKALCRLGGLEANEARMDLAREHLTRALDLAASIGAEALECEARNGLGILESYLGRMEDARRHFEAALAAARRIGERRWEGGLLGNLGNLHSSQGRLPEARQHFEAGLAVARELGNRQWEGNALCNLGLLHHAQGETDRAADMLQQSLQVARQMGHARLEAIVLCNLGIVNESRGDLDAAQADFEAALAVARDLGDRRSEGQFLGYLGVLHGRRGRFDEARRKLELGRARLQEVSDPIDLCVIVCNQAEVEFLAGDVEPARTLFAEAEGIAHDVGGEQLSSELVQSLSRVRALLSGG